AMVRSACAPLSSPRASAASASARMVATTRAVRSWMRAACEAVMIFMGCSCSVRGSGGGEEADDAGGRISREGALVTEPLVGDLDRGSGVRDLDDGLQVSAGCGDEVSHLEVCGGDDLRGVVPVEGGSHGVLLVCSAVGKTLLPVGTG